MRLAARIKRLLDNLVGRDGLESTLDAELRGYLDEMTERKIRQGILPAEARRQALLEAGGLDQVKEQVRDTWLGTGIETTIRDVHYALRTLRRSPGFTIAALLSRRGAGRLRSGSVWALPGAGSSGSYSSRA